MQNVYVEVIRLYPVVKDRMKIIVVTYILTALVYIIIGCIGGYGILDRKPIISGAKTIMGYFYANQWQPFIL